MCLESRKKTILGNSCGGDTIVAWLSKGEGERGEGERETKGIAKREEEVKKWRIGNKGKMKEWECEKGVES